MKRIPYFWFLLFLIAVPVIAQESCPADVLRAFARAGTACTDVERNYACYGNGSVQGVFDARSNDSFGLVGERADTNYMQQLLVSSFDDYGVALIQLQMSLVDTELGRNVMLLAFGEVTLTNHVPVRPTVPIESTGVLNIRALPDREADILAQYPLRTTITANGITAEGGWLRVEIPDTSEIGWVAHDVIATADDVTTLNIVDVNTPFFRPFQLFSVITGSGEWCAGAPQSGLLVQAPNTVDAVEMTINGVDVRLSGTMVVQIVPGAAMTIRQLDGDTLLQIDSDKQWLVAGSEVNIPIDVALNLSGSLLPARPIETSALTGLPVNNLNYRVRLSEPTPQAEIDAQITALEAEQSLITDSSTDNDVMSGQRCIRTAQGRATLYAGPGTFYEVIREIGNGSRLYPVLRLTDSEGVSWLQLNNGHWILASSTESEGQCREIPITEIVQPPLYNMLVLETCDTSNGPIRSGQWVQIEFVDGGWPTYEEALLAPRIDPGRITVNQQRLWIEASSPRNVAEERYYSTFSGAWYAESGTYRIVGNRLSYSVICDVTVPLG